MAGLHALGGGWRGDFLAGLAGVVEEFSVGETIRLDARDLCP